MKSTTIRSEWKGDRACPYTKVAATRNVFRMLMYTLHREMNLILWMQSTAIFLNAKIFFPLNRKDENEQLLLSLVFFHEKQDAINKSHRLDQFLMEILNISCGWIWYNTQISWWAWRFLGHWSQSQPSNREPLIIQSSDMLLYFLSFTCRFPFHFTPLKKGSLYDTAPLCFFYLGVQGAFLLKPEEAFETGRF